MQHPNLLNQEADPFDDQPKPEPSLHARLVHQAEIEKQPWLQDPETMDPIPAIPQRRRRWGVWIGVLLLVGALLFTAPLIYGGARAGLAAQRAKTSLEAVKSKLQAADLAGAEVAVIQAQVEMENIRLALADLGAWRFMPWIGPQIRALEEVQRSGALAIDGAVTLIQAAGTVQDALASVGVMANVDDLGIAPHRSFKDLSADEKRQVLAKLYGILPDMRLAREKIDLAEQAFKNIPQNDLAGPIRNALAPIAVQLPTLKTRLDQSVSLMEVFIPLMGYPTQKRYLVLLQNSDELRPTGGFIGNVGILDVDAADIRELEFEDVYAVDDPVIGKLKDVPPDILKRELGVTTWYLRDSNWSPDYPQSAARILDVYTRSNELAGQPTKPLDGVIALQPALFSKLLKITGPIVIEGKEFNSTNFFDEIQYDVEQGFLQNGLPVSQRKEIVAKVGDALVEKLFNQPAARWLDLFDIATQSLQEKDALIYVKDRPLQQLVEAKNWGGNTLSSANDYLWVIDTNLAALKTDGVMDKTINYTLDLRNPNNPVATVKLVYANNYSFANRKDAWRYTRYRSYTRLYVPEGSEFISSSSAKPDVFKDLGKTVFGAFWVIEPNKTGTLTFSYRLPASLIPAIRAGNYNLLLQKQPGNDSRVHLDVLLPSNVKKADPAEASAQFGDARYDVTQTINEDKRFSVGW